MDYLKLLIADDEENIRNGLKCILDWQELGFKVCGEAANGKDSIQQIIDLQPDLVIQDIKMPGCTGIDVITKVKEHCEKNELQLPAFIILSGFSEFDYAQKALNLGAKAYLLKPVDEDDLLNKVKKISQEIQTNKQTQFSAENSNVFETKELLRKMFQTKNVPDISKTLHLPFFKSAETSSFSVILCNLDYCKNSNFNDFEKSLDNYFSFFTKTILRTENKIYVILKTTNVSAVQNSLNRITNVYNGQTFIVNGINAKGLNGIIESYNNCLELEKYLFFFSNRPYISNQEITGVQENISKNDLNSYIDNLIFCIETYDKKTLDETKVLIKEKTFNITASSDEIKKTYIYSLIELNYRLSKKYPEREFSNGETFDVVKSLISLNNFDEIYDSFCKILDNFLEEFNFNTADSVIVKVLAYIKTNYASDLKLETLGELFNCNSAYLGKKFKKYTGMQFNAYLDKIRMDVVIDKLTNTDLKIYQISKLVGFTNTDYFFMKFKKYTGITPKEFKKRVENEKNM